MILRTLLLHHHATFLVILDLLQSLLVDCTARASFLVTPMVSFLRNFIAGDLLFIHCGHRLPVGLYHWKLYDPLPLGPIRPLYSYMERAVLVLAVKLVTVFYAD
jgi:hypothetical protein